MSSATIFAWHFKGYLMLIDIRIKFREDILNGFQVIEWTRFLWQIKFQGK